MTRLKFGDAEHIAMVKEYGNLVSLLHTYRDLILRKRNSTYRGKPTRKTLCRLCKKAIEPKALYYSCGKRSAHDLCVDKAHDRRRELAPTMGAR